MAVEVADNFGIPSKNISLGMGITRRFLDVNTRELSRKIDRDMGVYITFDCESRVFENDRALTFLSKQISLSIMSLLGTLRGAILVVGLGNGGVIADALGTRTVQGIACGVKRERRLCAVESGVYGATGIQSRDIVSAIVDKIKPSAVILVDSLATGTVKRVGTSFQLTSAGIRPGGGVGEEKAKIDRSVLSVPTLAIGVPLMLNIKTAAYRIVSDYAKNLGTDVDEYKLLTSDAFRDLSSLVVAPKDIDYFVNTAASVISSSINRAFS